MLEEVEQSNEVEGTQETTPETQETKAPIQEKQEDAETLRKEIEKLRPYESNFKSLQRKYQELLDSQKGTDVRREVADLKDMFKMLIAAQSQGMDVSPDELDDMPKKQRKDLIKEYEDIERRKQSERAQQDFQSRAVNTYQEAEEVFGDDVDTLYNIRNLIRSGDFDLAEKKIAKAKEKNVVQQTTKESEAEMRKRIEKEVREQIFKEKGGNIVDTGEPSGGSSNDAEFLKEFSEGKRSSSEDFKRAKKLTGT